MLIGIDASRANKPQKTGTETYAYCLIQALSLIDPKNNYILYSNTPLRDDLVKLPGNFKSKIMPFPKLWSQLRLSLEMLKNPPQVLFEPSHTIPLIHPQKTIVTLHDLGFKHFPHLYTPFERRYHDWCMRFSIRHAWKIITISKYTKDDLIKTYGAPSQKIEVVYHGCDPNFKPVKSKIVSQPYIYFVGRLEEKKNIVRLIRAYELLRRERDIKHQLVLAGKPGYGFDKILNEIRILPTSIQKDIKILGYVNQERAIKLMQNADIFFFPSLFEGFGLPIIEAMACGIPVVASKITSIPEIAGSAAMLVNPKEPFEMAVGLSRLIHSKTLCQSYISKGLVRASIYSWSKSAEKTLKIIQTA